MSPEKKAPEEKKNCCPLHAVFSCSAGQDRPPVIARVFDIFGVIQIAGAIVLFCISFILEEAQFYFVFSTSLLISGLLYTGGAELLRACAATAENTRELLLLKRAELEHTGK